MLLVSMASASGRTEAATLLPFPIQFSEPVTVNTAGGTPRLAIEIGGTTRYAPYVSGSGSSTLTFSYTIQTGDLDADGIALISPLQLNGGNITDMAGTPAMLNFTPPDTSGIKIDAVAPAGYSVAFGADTVTNANKAALSFTITSPETGVTYSYTVTSSGGGTPLAGSGTLASSPETVTGLNVSSLPDGVLTLSLTLSDATGNTGAAVTDTIPMAVLTSNLVGHWTFDTTDISGTTALDRSSRNNNGTLVNSPSQSSGVIGGALNFNGSTTAVSLPNAASLKMNLPATISLWVNFSNPSVAANLFANDNNTTVHAGLRFNLNALGRPEVQYGTINTCGVAARRNKGAPATITAGTWYHLAAVIQGQTNMTIYLNGVDIGGAYSGTATGTNPVYSSNLGVIGGSTGCGTTIPALSGQMDDVRIYNTALTATQIGYLYNAH